MRPYKADDAWLQFLAAEAAGREEEAETALAALFAALPRPAPAPGFAERVMARISRRSLFAHRGVRFGVAASLALAALSIVLIGPMLVPLAGLVSFAGFVDGGLRLMTSLTVRFASGLSLWEAFAGTAGTVGRALLRPESLPFVFAQFAVAGLALRGLISLARRQRSPNHAVLR